MADEERRSAKRSRFDQTEPDVKRSSRFDRRSRSPAARKSDSRRSRSPLSKEPLSPAPEDKKKVALDPAAAAGECNRWSYELTIPQADAFASSRCGRKDQRADTGQEGYSTCRRPTDTICEYCSPLRMSTIQYKLTSLLIGCESIW